MHPVNLVSPCNLLILSNRVMTGTPPILKCSTCMHWFILRQSRIGRLLVTSCRVKNLDRNPFDLLDRGIRLLCLLSETFLLLYLFLLARILKLFVLVVSMVLGIVQIEFDIPL